MPKAKDPVDLPDDAEPVLEEVPDAIVDVPEIIEPLEADAPAAATPRKSLGVKEVIPFRWKLIGTAQGAALTLFKAVEREDVDAQYERALRDGYYTDLQIMDADAKVEQSKSMKLRLAAAARLKETKPAAKFAAKPATAKPAAALKPKSAKTDRLTADKSAAPAATAKPVKDRATSAKPAAPAPAAASRPKPAAKATPKTAKKKPAERKAAPKRSAKGK